jgi:hypothetical protein
VAAPLIADYLVWVSCAAVGIVQVTAAIAGLPGLLLARTRPALCRWAGASVVVAAFAWFFATGERNLPDTAGGIDGVKQAMWFAIGAGAGVAASLLAASALNHRWALAQEPGTPDEGLGALSHDTFARLLARNLRAGLRQPSSLWRGER